MGKDIRSVRPASPLLEVRDLRTYFHTEQGIVKAVDGLDLVVHRGEILGLVGESGCGKSVASLSILRLIEPPGEILSSGIIRFDGLDLMSLAEPEMTRIRGNRIGMIFQQPISSLNPVFKIGEQIAEVLWLHQNLSGKARWARAVELLEQVRLPDAAQRAHAYPHELSGGQAQRVMIAMVLACSPALLIADEPTTALDVTVQAQILDLLRDLRSQTGASIILITHDLGVIAEIADRVAVMYAGRIVEQANVAALFAAPRHPYTQGLMASILVLGQMRDKLEVIPGTVPDLIDLPPGCRFADRCRAREQYRLAICREREPDLLPVRGNHRVRCWLYQSAAGYEAPLAASSSSPSASRSGEVVGG
ncbi:MAG: ABC transporter ATP-binding protein [Chloroflexota bacterium]